MVNIFLGIFLVGLTIFIVIDFKRNVKSVAFPHINDVDYTIKFSMDNNEFDQKFLDEDKEEFNVTSDDGVNINGYIIRGNKPETIVFCHGVGWSRYGMIKYWSYFKELGWNGVFYDHRGHGASGESVVSYGYKEKNDLKKIIKTLSETKDLKIVGVYGESMGGAIVMQYLEIDDKVDFAICDCPFGDLEEQIRHQLNSFKVPKAYKDFFIKYTSNWLKKKFGFSLSDISPKKTVMNSKIPLLLVHGDQDDYVPAHYSEYIYNNRRDIAPTEMLVIKGADHANAINVNRKKYEKKLTGFLNKYYFNKT